MLGIIIGTGPSLNQSAERVRELGDRGALLFGCNSTYQDFDLNVWLSCDPAWHAHYGKIDLPHTDQWHWDSGICREHGYRYAEGVWMVEGRAYPRDEHITPPGPCGGLWMADKSRISLNHCSAAQLLNLACNQYECDTVLLVGHDFHYNGPTRHYFSGLSETDGEYPKEIRKFSKFDKRGQGDDLLSVYKRIAEQDGLPRIINCTPDSALKWFPVGDLEDWL